VKPYYDDGTVTIYHGDALDVLGGLAGLKVDAVVTDPPYASGSRTEQAKKSSGQMVRGQRFAAPIENDQMTTARFVWLMRSTLYAVRPMLPAGGSCSRSSTGDNGRTCSARSSRSTSG
jgi:tRNA G10  N-methylase Trm11